MLSQVGQLPVEISRPESAKFRYPLLLLHGLWTGSWVWGGLSGYLAHRGWESWAPSLLRAGMPAPDHASAIGQLEQLGSALPAPPIILAHDTGLLAAVALAARLQAPAVVAIAPLVAPRDAKSGAGIFAWPQFWRTLAWGARVPPPRGARLRAFLGSATGAVGGQLLPDSGAIFRALTFGRLPLPSSIAIPGLVLSGAADVVSSPAAGARIAARFRWDHRVYPRRGHLPMREPGWEEMAAEVHRWTVRTLGADLLLLLEDEGEEPA